MPLCAIMRAHVHGLLDTLVAKGLTTGVNRAQAVISRLFTLDRWLIDGHPGARMRNAGTDQRNRTSSATASPSRTRPRSSNGRSVVAGLNPRHPHDLLN